MNFPSDAFLLLLQVISRHWSGFENEFTRGVSTPDSRYLQAFNICDDIYQLQKVSTLKDDFLNLVKNYPQYRELEYIVNKLTN